MAREIADFNGTVVAPDGTYPYGRVKDAPGGTIVDETMIGDTIQFTQKLMAEAGVTPNNDPDNNSDGWQIYEAFETLAGRNAWGIIPDSGAGSTTFTTVGGGTLTLSAGDIVYQRLQILGKTVRYGLQIRSGVIAGTVSAIKLNITALGGLTQFSNFGGWISGVYLGAPNLLVQLDAAPQHLIIYNVTGGSITNFSAGAFEIDINITAEID